MAVRRYPAPKEATHKVRGRSDVLEMMCGAGAVDPELLTVKTFYFFFYSAFGSLFPLMGVYFKQMGMNAGQCGLLIGTRPFVEFLSAPFWGGLADRWHRGRTLLLASLGAWIVFTLPLSWVQPGAVACVQPLNETAYVLATPSYDDEPPAATRIFKGVSSVGRSSPLPVTDALNYNPEANDNWVTPLHSSIVYRTPDIQKTFFLLLLLVVIGEFFSAPAITLADSAVITLLGEDADRYVAATAGHYLQLDAAPLIVLMSLWQIWTPTDVRLARLGAGDVLRGHCAGPQHCLQLPSLRWSAALREELHYLFRNLLRAHGRRSHHCYPGTIELTHSNYLLNFTAA